MTDSVLHLSSSDISGGAAIAAYRLHDELQRAGVTSHMAVGWKRSHDPYVHVAPPSRGLEARLRRRIEAKARSLEMRRYAGTLSPTLELFSSDSVPGADPLAGVSLDADVINLHWVAGLVDYRRFFARLGSDRPLVWTLHDMNPFTGGCHYALGCERFTTGCGACPQLGSTNVDDISRRILQRKSTALKSRQGSITRVVAPSAWLATEAKSSAPMGLFQVDIIPNGVDASVFRARSRSVAREVFGLPQDSKIVLFAAESLANHRKGFDLLLAALDGLRQKGSVTLAAVGAIDPRTLPPEVCLLGRIEGERLLSFAYSAADVFVSPTRADNLPNVVLEAMACGTPVVSFDVGGVPDMVRPGVTGLLAPPEDVAGLRHAIETLLDDDDLRARLSAECRRVVEQEYTLELQATRYRSLYEELISASRSLTSV